MKTSLTAPHSCRRVRREAKLPKVGRSIREVFSRTSFDDGPVAVTIGAGVQLSGMYTAVNEHGRMLIGGISARVLFKVLMDCWRVEDIPSCRLAVVLANSLLTTPLIAKLIIP